MRGDFFLAVVRHIHYTDAALRRRSNVNGVDTNAVATDNLPARVGVQSAAAPIDANCTRTPSASPAFTEPSRAVRDVDAVCARAFALDINVPIRSVQNRENQTHSVTAFTKDWDKRSTSAGSVEDRELSSHSDDFGPGGQVIWCRFNRNSTGDEEACGRKRGG